MELIYWFSSDSLKLSWGPKSTQIFRFIVISCLNLLSLIILKSFQLKTCKPFDQRRSEKFFKQSQTGRAALLTFNNTRRKERREEPRSDTKLGNWEHQIQSGVIFQISNHSLETITDNAMDLYDEALPQLFPSYYIYSRGYHNSSTFQTH